MFHCVLDIIYLPPAILGSILYMSLLWYNEIITVFTVINTIVKKHCFPNDTRIIQQPVLGKLRQKSFPQTNRSLPALFVSKPVTCSTVPWFHRRLDYQNPSNHTNSQNMRYREQEQKKPFINRENSDTGITPETVRAIIHALSVNNIVRWWKHTHRGGVRVPHWLKAKDKNNLHVAFELRKQRHRQHISIIQTCTWRRIIVHLYTKERQK